MQENELKDILDKIQKIDNNFFVALESVLPDVLDFILKTEYKATFLALNYLQTNLCFLKNGVFNLCQNDDLYSAKVVYRSYIEHLLKFQYIWTRFVIEKNDNTGVEYYAFAYFSEVSNYARSLDGIIKMIDIEDVEGSPYEELRKIRSEYSRYSKKEFQQKIDQFSYKRIVKYLLENNSPLKDYPFYPNLILTYSELSSFVHGGPSTHVDGEKFINFSKNRNDEYAEMVKFCLNFWMMTVELFIKLIAAQKGGEKLVEKVKLFLVKDKFIL
jgi:hypothetical protein